MIQQVQGLLSICRNNSVQMKRVNTIITSEHIRQTNGTKKVSVRITFHYHLAQGLKKANSLLEYLEIRNYTPEFFNENSDCPLFI